MRKKLAFSGFILATCITAIMVFFVAIGGIVLVNALVSAGAGRFITVIICTAIFFIATLVLNASSISATTNSEKFNKRKGLVITSIVFNFLFVLACVYSMVGMDISGAGVVIETGGTIALYIIFALAIITANVLIIIDLARNGKPDARVETEHKSNVLADNGNDNLEEYIQKLIQMKEKNLITEEEFNQLKKREIEKRL